MIKSVFGTFILTPSGIGVVLIAASNNEVKEHEVIFFGADLTKSSTVFNWNVIL